jgi:uncharacterized protein YjbI with pentapeptide repeats
MPLTVLIQAGHEGGIRNGLNGTTVSSPGTQDPITGAREVDWNIQISAAAEAWLRNAGVSVIHEDAYFDTTYTVDYAVFNHIDIPGSRGGLGYQNFVRNASFDTSSILASYASFASSFRSYVQPLLPSQWSSSDNYTDYVPSSDASYQSMSHYYGGGFVHANRGELIVEWGSISDSWLATHLTQLGQWEAQEIYLNYFGSLPTPAPAITVSQVLSARPSGDLGVGQQVEIGLSMSGSVMVSGSPVLTLSDGGVATYDAGNSTATALLFTYTVAAGQNTAALGVTGINLNGATIRDSNGNSADLSGAHATFNGLQIDTAAPVVSSPASLTIPGNSGATTIGIAAPTDASALTVTVTSLPTDGTVLLSDGSTAVAQGQTLTAAQLSGLEFRPTANLFGTSSAFGYRVTDAAGNSSSGTANLTIGASGQVTVTQVLSSRSSGDFGPGQQVEIGLAMSGPVTVSGSPVLSLNDGGIATYDARNSTATALFFTYTVAAGQNTTALGVTGINLNGAAIRDSNGNSADFSGVHAAFNGLQIDTTAPVISPTSLTVPGNSGATPIGISAPSDASSLTVTVTSLPTDGTVLLSDGSTAVAQGQTLTVAQLTGLEFRPTANLFATSSSFGYQVTDAAGNSSSGSANLTINPAQSSSPVGSISINDVSMVEGNSGGPTFAFNVTRTGGTAPFSVDFQTADGWATVADHDYGATSGQLDFGPGVNSSPIFVTVYGDARYESDESFSLNLSNATNGATISNSVGTGTILNDDPPVGQDEIGDFDPFYYFHTYPDIAATITRGTDPITLAYNHYENFGWHEGRNPDAYFSTTGYLNANPDIRAAHVNPLDHYESNGWREGRDPSANFSTSLYLIQNPDVRAAGIDPLQHFLQFGLFEGRPAPAAIGHGGEIGDFDPHYYLLANPDVAGAVPAGANPATFAFQHFETYGWREGRDPNAYFSTVGYLNAYPDIRAAGVNPLDHYEFNGWQEGRDPSPQFDTQQYLSHYADVAAAHIDPLQHYLTSGAWENRLAFGDGRFA